MRPRAISKQVFVSNGSHVTTGFGRRSIPQRAHRWSGFFAVELGGDLGGFCNDGASAGGALASRPAPGKITRRS